MGFLLEQSVGDVDTEADVLLDVPFILARPAWPGASVAALWTQEFKSTATMMLAANIEEAVYSVAPNRHPRKLYTLPIDVSLDGHIVPAQGERHDCVLPIVCIAGDTQLEANIVALVTSVVCQRYVWGIRLPTVGLEFSDTGASVRVVVGWMREEEEDAQDAQRQRGGRGGRGGGERGGRRGTSPVVAYPISFPASSSCTRYPD
ncbi:hypothetical protein BDZ97DRAFT_426466 [Flammula alnicola]|nr:hypothetical protein BDZ97DRAFT_426466 [Flammula alnicola]